MAALAPKAKQWIDAFNKKDMKKLMALYADNAKNLQPHHQAPLKGTAAIQADLENFLNAFPDGKLKATAVVATKDTVAMEWKFTGTQSGPLVGPQGTMPATNKKVTLLGAEFTRHNAKGLIVDERGYFDMGAFMMQLGMTSPPQTAG